MSMNLRRLFGIAPTNVEGHSFNIDTTVIYIFTERIAVKYDNHDKMKRRIPIIPLMKVTNHMA